MKFVGIPTMAVNLLTTLPVMHTHVFMYCTLLLPHSITPYHARPSPSLSRAFSFLRSHMLGRVGIIIKSSSGFKSTASISITMTDDPVLPNQMAHPAEDCQHKRLRTCYNRLPSCAAHPMAAVS
ncbi:hypothetical protein Vafri_5302 [Volvox africanus]|uniref:Uncharacterized protein n=1 Tax=Volvox africanus TaxID=51714 RepID=A0A8J4AVR5_9CHLO|nr:hypothetical protein Vafri_5302 [Volvox africanus]